MLIGKFSFREVTKQLADAGVVHPGSGLLVGVTCILLHRLHVAAGGLDAHRPNLSAWPPLHQALHVLSADQRDMRSEAFREHIDQPATVLVLLGRHVGEHSGALGVVFLKLVSKIGIDPAILLLAGDDQREQVTLGKVAELAHGQRDKFMPIDKSTADWFI
ncbi:MAG: hypothetical protein ACRYG8_37925 [Janthinobacterium lividum]